MVEPAKVRAVRTGGDRFDLILRDPSQFRMLQLTDTHFGTPTDENRAKDLRSRRTIRRLVDEQKPDLVFHTGDFINNDREGVEFGAEGFMADLGVPWALVFGNHDHPRDKPGNISLDTYYGRLENSVSGFVSTPAGRQYCGRIDVRGERGAPVLSLFTFNSGDPVTGMVVNQAQRAWFRAEMEADRSKEDSTPILVMQHFPTVEYKTVFEKLEAVGRQGEKVCFELDQGAVFGEYLATMRVKGIFCGHDHVNDYVGEHQGIRLVYGRVSGWSGYGDWQRGGRLVRYAPGSRAFRTKVVLPSGVVERPEWSATMVEE